MTDRALSDRWADYDTIDSTNAEAHRRAAAGERGPLWISARRQTAGRGRHGRVWESEPGNLFATLLVALPVPARIAAQASFAASLAVYDAVAAFLPDSSRLRLKWPNDLLLDRKKLAGILIESTAQGAAGTTVVAIGCGINVAHAPASTRTPATSLAAHGVNVEPADLLAALDRTMRHWLSAWTTGASFAAVRQAWCDHAIGIGSEISVNMDGRPLAGIFHGLAEDGALILCEAGDRVRHLHAGEVTITSLSADAT